MVLPTRPVIRQSAPEETGADLLAQERRPEKILAAAIRLLTNDSVRRHIERRGLAIASTSSSRERAAQFHALCAKLVRER